MITEKDIGLIKERMTGGYYITEDGIFESCVKLDDIADDLLEVSSKCLGWDIEKGCYLDELIRWACFVSAMKAEKAILKNLNIDDDDPINDIACNELY